MCCLHALKACNKKLRLSCGEVLSSTERPDAANKALDVLLARFSAKYSEVMTKLKKDQEELLAFYNFPSEHWASIIIMKPIELTFLTVRLRKPTRARTIVQEKQPFKDI
ncbi:MAG: transposase [Arsenophonus sp. NEOnobi-MAG3]